MSTLVHCDHGHLFPQIPYTGKFCDSFNFAIGECIAKIRIRQIYQMSHHACAHPLLQNGAALVLNNRTSFASDALNV